MRLVRRKRAADRPPDRPEVEARYELWLVGGDVVTVLGRDSLAGLLRMLGRVGDKHLDNVVFERRDGGWRREITDDEVVSLMEGMQHREDSETARAAPVR